MSFSPGRELKKAMTILSCHSRERDCIEIRHPGQVPRSGMRAGIQNDLIFRQFPGFPFDFAQGGEPVEPRVSPNPNLIVFYITPPPPIFNFFIAASNFKALPCLAPQIQSSNSANLKKRIERIFRERGWAHTPCKNDKRLQGPGNG
jgi:hypothetical protein